MFFCESSSVLVLAPPLSRISETIRCCVSSSFSSSVLGLIARRMMCPSTPCSSENSRTRFRKAFGWSAMSSVVSASTFGLSSTTRYLPVSRSKPRTVAPLPLYRLPSSPRRPFFSERPLTVTCEP